MKFRKKPVVVDAFIWDGSDLATTHPDWFFKEVCENNIIIVDNKPNIKTLEGMMVANIGDYIIRGVKGEIYPCKPDIFELSYEPVQREYCGSCNAILVNGVCDNPDCV